MRASRWLILVALLVLASVVALALGTTQLSPRALWSALNGEGDQTALPEVEIQDWPSLAYRGIMVDMSHGALPTEQEVQRQIDFLARWKANQYYFYSEASIELEGFPASQGAEAGFLNEFLGLGDVARKPASDAVEHVELLQREALEFFA